MICISLWQPWASALFAPRPGGSLLAIKPDETRHWPLPGRLIGKEIGIHAAKRDTRDEREFWNDIVLSNVEFRRAFVEIGIYNYSTLPRGAIIGSVVFASPIRTESAKPDEFARTWGNHGPERFSWPVAHRTFYMTPIPCVGHQGFFEAEVNLS